MVFYVFLFMFYFCILMGTKLKCHKDNHESQTLTCTLTLSFSHVPSLHCSLLIPHVTKLLLSLFHQVAHPPVCINSLSVCDIYSTCCPPELWSVTMVFVSCLSNAIITLNSYSVKRTSIYSSVSWFAWLLFFFLSFVCFVASV